MSQENRISIQISVDDLTKIEGAIKTLQDVLTSHLIALTPDERHELPKMSDRTIPFVEKGLNYAQSNPDFAPRYLDINELKIDLEAVKTLTKILRPLEQLLSGLSDAILLSGSEAYTAALAYYSSVKGAVKRNVPDAKPIYEELSKRFPKRTKKTIMEVK